MDSIKTPALLDVLADIDCDWLTQILAAAGYTARVSNFMITSIGAGNVSDTARILIEAHGEAPESIVAKFRPALEILHAHGVNSGAYYREEGAYRLFATASDGCRTPRILWLAGTQDNINLVMEDLSLTTRAGNQITGCSISDAQAVITQLARLHRAFSPLPENEAPEWAIRMPEAGDYWVPVLERAVPIIHQRFGDILPARHLLLIEQAATVSRVWHDLNHPMMSITHGDPRVDNVLFDDQANGTEAILIDWQVTGVRNPMHDVGYFLSGSVSVEDRRSAEQRLLALYAEEFGKGYNLDAIRADYRVQLVSGLMTTAAAVALLPDSPQVNQLLLALLERNCAAAEDWDTIAAIQQHD